jgi:hypothetical protein
VSEKYLLQKEGNCGDVSGDVLVGEVEAVVTKAKEFIDRCAAIDAVRRPQGRRVGRARLETCKQLVPLLEELRSSLLALRRS